MKKRIIIKAIALILVFALVVGGVYLSAKFKSKGDTTAKTTEATEAPAATTTTTEAETTTMAETTTVTDTGVTVNPDGSILFKPYNGYTGKYCVAVNRQMNVVTVYEKDDNGQFTKPVKAFACSCGKEGNETPTGTFVTQDKYEWLTMVDRSEGQYTIRIKGAIWFHSVCYNTRDKGDLEYEEYNKLGSPASLGCVRLCVADAKWLFDNLTFNTVVTIYDSPLPGPLGKPKTTKIDVNDSRRGWDPTDPDPENPWNK